MTALSNFGFRAKKSLATRIALASCMFGFLMTGGAIVIGFYALAHQLDARSSAELLGKRDLLTHVLSEIPSPQTVSSAQHRFGDLLIGHDDLHLALKNPASGQTILSFSSIAKQSMIALNARLIGPDSVHLWTASTGENLNGVSATAPVADGRLVRYYLSLDRQQDYRLLTGFVKTSLIGWPLLLLVVALSAWLIARTSLAPLRRFQSHAAAIGAQSLSQRISSSGLPAELLDLAEEFNSMLERIDEGYRRLQDFSGELAHEMRTPVATLMGRTQVALSRPRTAAELREVLEGNVEELERLARLIFDMLFIARSDNKQDALHHELLDLTEEALRVADYLSLVAEEHGVAVHVTGTAAVTADRLLVQRAITNLLSNAIRHATVKSTIGIAIKEEMGQVTLSVTNSGETIAPHHLERIFERFYRIDSGRARGQGGSGLGLAIVRSIMEAHGGQAKAYSSAGGTTEFILIFPAAGDHPLNFVEASALQSTPAWR